MKKALVIPALLIVMALGYLIRNHMNYGEALPPGLPSDIPIIEGKVISGRRTLFEDGRGYVLDIQTDLSYGEVVEFYADRYEDGRPQQLREWEQSFPVLISVSGANESFLRFTPEKQRPISPWRYTLGNGGSRSQVTSRRAEAFWYPSNPRTVAMTFASSRVSRTAAASGASVASTRPHGILHSPSSECPLACLTRSAAWSLITTAPAQTVFFGGKFSLIAF